MCLVAHLRRLCGNGRNVAMEESELKQTVAHVLAVPFPFQAHINPLLHLSRELAAHDHGITVSFLNIPYYHARMPASSTPANLRFLSLPSTSCVVPPDMRVPESLHQCLRNIDLRMGEEVEGVMEGPMRQEDFPPLTCLIADIRLPFAQALADRYGIARVAFWTQSAASLAYHVKVFGGLYQLPEDKGAVIESICPGVPRHRLRDTPVVFRREVVGEVIYEMMRRPFLQPGLGRAAAVVMNTIEELEEATVRELEWDTTEVSEEGRKPDVLCVGPLDRRAPELASTGQQQSEEAIRHEALEWLDVQAPASVLYICFGTLVCISRPEFESLAAGIEASGVPFLWALRPSLVAGGDDDPAEAFQARTRDRGLVLAWVPQALVLAHPSVGGFLSHCGWNSTLEAISAGVPVLCRPKSGEQRLNLRCIVDAWRFGLALENDEEEEGPLSVRHVEGQIRRLMQAGDERLRETVASLKEAASAAVAKGGSSDSHLRRLVQLITTELLEFETQHKRLP